MPAAITLAGDPCAMLRLLPVAHVSRCGSSYRCCFPLGGPLAYPPLTCCAELGAVTDCKINAVFVCHQMRKMVQQLLPTVDEHEMRYFWVSEGWGQRGTLLFLPEWVSADVRLVVYTVRLG